MSVKAFALLLLSVVTIAGCAPANSASTDTASTPPAADAPVAVDAPAAAPAETAAAPVAGAKSIDLTPNNTKIEFVGAKPDGEHPGGFKTFTGKLELGADGNPVKVMVDIETASIWSDADKLTDHLKGADFFEVNAYPKSTFTSTSIVAKTDAKATHMVTGDLTLHGVTKPISFPAHVTNAGGELVWVSEFTISKKEFGMTYGEGKINDPVAITVAIKTAAK